MHAEKMEEKKKQLAESEKTKTKRLSQYKFHEQSVNYKLSEDLCGTLREMKVGRCYEFILEIITTELCVHFINSGETNIQTSQQEQLFVFSKNVILIAEIKIQLILPTNCVGCILLFSLKVTLSRIDTEVYNEEISSKFDALLCKQFFFFF